MSLYASHHHCFAVAAFAILPLEKISVQSTSTILYLCLVSSSMLIIPSSHIKNALAGLRVSTPDPNKEQLGLSNATKTFWEQWRPFHQVDRFAVRIDWWSYNIKRLLRLFILRRIAIDEELLNKAIAAEPSRQGLKKMPLNRRQEMLTKPNREGPSFLMCLISKIDIIYI